MRFGEDDPVSWWMPVIVIALWIALWRLAVWLAAQV